VCVQILWQGELVAVIYQHDVPRVRYLEWVDDALSVVLNVSEVLLGDVFLQRRLADDTCGIVEVLDVSHWKHRVTHAEIHVRAHLDRSTVRRYHLEAQTLQTLTVTRA